MLIDRFPFLSLVPQVVIAEHLLDLPLARVRATLTRTTANNCVLALVPQTDASDILHRLNGHNWLNMIFGVTYSVDIDETGVVSSSADGKEMREVPAPIEFLLNRAYVLLLNLARQYVQELKLLPPVESSWECMRNNVACYLDHLRNLDSFGRAFGPPPRVRSVCLGCFQRELGQRVDLQTNSQSGWQLVTSSVKASERMMRAMHICLGEPLSPDVMPIFVHTPHEQLRFAQALYRLYEAGMDSCLKEVYVNERDVFMGQRLSAGHEGIES